MRIARGEAERFRRTIAARLGLHFDDGKLDDLADLLRARIDATGASGTDEYTRRLDANEVATLAERLTVGETYFFRYREQFDAFEGALAAFGTRSLRILSAGCATGDEPYSLAIAIFERAPTLAARTEIVAFDVNPAAVAKARTARYAPWALREVSDEIRARYFARDGSSYKVAPEVRAMVRFERRNLIDDDAAFFADDVFDVVFCRNVIMYFDAETMRTVMQRVSRALRPGGLLFLGHAETLRGISNDFHLRHAHETFFYERKSERTALAAIDPVRPRDASAEIARTIAFDDASWVDVIRRASERVAHLSAERQVPARAAIAPRVERAKVLDMVRAERFGDALAMLGASDADLESKLLRAVLLTNQGELARAETLCGEILASDDLHAGAHYVKALCREHASDRDGALEHDRMATYLEPTFAMPHLHVGILERRAGNLERARAALVRALELIPAEDPSRILLFGGGFSREALGALCRNEMRRCGGSP